MFGLQLPLTCNPWTTLSNPCNKVRGKWILVLKKSSCVFLPASLSLSCLRLINSVRQYVSSIYMYISAWICRWQYNISRFGACARRVLQGLRMNLVTVNGSLKHYNPTSRKRTRKDTGMERSQKKKQEQLATKKGRERNRPTRKEQKKKKKTERKKEKEKKKRL